MHQTKVIQLLSRFSKNDLKRFESFLESPFFNTSEKVRSLYQILVRYHPAFDSPKLDKEKIHKRLYQKTDYSDQMMRELSSSLFKLAKEYLSYQQMKKSPLRMGNVRFDWLFQNGLHKICEQELAQGHELIDQTEVRDYEYYYQKWVSEYNEYLFQSGTQRDIEYKMLKQKGYGAHLHSLNKFYILRFLESYVYMMNMSKIFNHPLDLALAAHIDGLAAAYVGQGDLLIDIHYYLFMLLREGEEAYYFKIKSIFLSGDSSVERNMMVEISINLENYCIQKLRDGDKRFGPEIAELYHFIVDHELMTMEGGVPYNFYKNVVTICTDLSEIEWVRVFAEKYRSMLPPRFRDEVYNYCTAYILFADRKYNEALRIITELSPYNEFAKLDIKTLTARIQYELGMFEQLDTLLDSFPHHINREILSPVRKENNNFFVIFLKQLIILNHQYSHKAWKQLSNDISEAAAFSNKRWFQEKLAEIRTGHMSAKN